MWSTFERENAPPKIEKPPTDSQSVVEFVRKRLQFDPDERQTEVLRSGTKRGILNCTRQWGKSTMAAALAVHRAYTKQGCTVLVASPSERQSGETVKKAEVMLDRAGIRTDSDGINAISLRLPNGSRIVGLPGKEGRVRGFSAVSLLLIDEAAQVEDSMYKALRPMLAVSDGDLWLMSTPFGKRGFFYECWEHGGTEWLRVSVKATECSRIQASFLEEERREMGAAWFQQEYMAEFIDNGSAVFGRDLVEAAIDDDVEPLW
jgi:terminase large subunit-like protein